MLLVAVDTSGKSGGITLAEGDQSVFRVIESPGIAGGMFSAQLVPSLAALLQKHGYSAADIDGFVAVSGPGSFTGLRVGLSAIKGLAEALKKPIAVVSGLEALASQSSASGTVAAALDAGRREVYFGLYSVEGGRALRISEQLLSHEQFLTEARNGHAVRLVTRDPGLAELGVSTGISVQVVDKPASEVAARIGLAKLLSGDTVAVEDLDANYIRRSDAEIFSKARP